MKKNFRFYDNRQKYLLFVTTTNEKNNYKSLNLPKASQFGKMVTEKIKGLLKDDDLTEFKNDNI